MEDSTGLECACYIPVVFTLLLALACGGKTADEITSADISAIRVEPSVLELTTRPGQPAEARFTAYATLYEPLRSGEEEIPLELVSWESSSPAAGEVDSEGIFTSVDTNGGVTEVSANHLGIEGSATVTVVFQDYLLEGDAPESAANAFAGADAAEGDSPAIRYPFSGARVPRNLEGLTFLWDAPSGHDLFRLHFQSDLADISIYTTEPTWSSSSDVWAQIASSNRGGAITVTLESGAWSGGQLTDARRGPPIDMVVNRLDARGSVLYWSTRDEAIMRIPLGQPETELYWKDPNGECVGCHTMNEAEDLMLVTHNGWNGTFSIIDVYDFEEPEKIIVPRDDSRATFSDFHPDGRFTAGVSMGQLELFATDDGVSIMQVPTEHPFTMPDWSPSGDALVGVHVRGTMNNDAEFHQGEIVEYPWDGEAFGSPRTLAYQDASENLYTPAYSPDGDWIAYVRAAEGDSHTNRDSELWLMSRDGSSHMMLATAMGDGVQQGYPRWAPLPDDDVLWLAWSAIRDYPPDSRAVKQPQIWVTAIDTAIAAQGEDPSSPPFWLPGQDASSDNHLPYWWKE